MNEIWKDIKDYEGLYQVSNWGRIKSLYGRNGVTILKAQDSHGYSRVALCKNKKYKKFFIHVLVAKAFLICLEGQTEVNHKDENQSNNRVDNLEWCTHSYNINYGTRNDKVAKKCSKAVYQYDKNGQLINKWKNGRECNKFGFDYRTISQCCNGRRKTHKGFIWSFIELSNSKIKDKTKREVRKDAKKVYQYDLKNNLVKTWNSALEAEKFGFENSNINKCCHNKKEKYKNYIWSFEPLEEAN